MGSMCIGARGLGVIQYLSVFARRLKVFIFCVLAVGLFGLRCRRELVDFRYKLGSLSLLSGVVVVLFAQPNDKIHFRKLSKKKKSNTSEPDLKVNGGVASSMPRALFCLIANKVETITKLQPKGSEFDLSFVFQSPDLLPDTYEILCPHTRFSELMFEL